MTPVQVSTSGVALLTYAYSSRVLPGAVYRNVNNVTVVHLHGPALPSAADPVLLNFTGTASPATGAFQLSTTQQANMISGLYYTNVHSTAHTTGEVRGQFTVTCVRTSAAAGVFGVATRVLAAALALTTVLAVLL